MANYLDYLRWRGDIPFKNNEFNEIDAAILASLAYLPIEEVFQYRSSMSLEDIADYILNDTSAFDEITPTMKLLLQLIKLSPRFANIKVIDSYTRNQISPAIQFTAITFKLQHHRLVVSYRGTDHSMVGWSEDLTMSYSPKIEGQQVANSYLTQTVLAHPNSKFILTGHSKGGNFAVYSGAFIAPSLQPQIKQIYNFDGPGFTSEVLAEAGFRNIKDITKTFVPQGSVFGLMLDHAEDLNIIKSEKKMLLQHNPLSWDVSRNSFVKVDSLQLSSNIIDQAIKDWLADVPADQRELLWTSLFEALADLNITDVDQLMRNKFMGTLQFSKAYLALDPPTRLIANKIINELVQNIRKNISGFSPFNNR